MKHANQPLLWSAAACLPQLVCCWRLPLLLSLLVMLLNNVVVHCHCTTAAAAKRSHALAVQDLRIVGQGRDEWVNVLPLE